MIRDSVCLSQYWGEWVAFDRENIRKKVDATRVPAVNVSYEPQFLYGLSKDYLRHMLRRYSKGDSITDLGPHFLSIIQYWEEAERLGANVWTSAQQHSRHAWAVNLDYYIDCFWLVGLALSLEIPNDQWQRLLFLVRNEGEDVLLDRIIATRQADRKIGASLCYPKPYAKLLTALDAPISKQAKALANFVESWYTDVGRAAKSGREKQAVPYSAPYWHNYHALEGGYFGYWCIEAVAAVKAFGLDDSLCIGHPHYPSDLLRPGLVTPTDSARLPRELVASLNAPPPPPVGVPEQISNWEAFKRVVVNKLRP